MGINKNIYIYNLKHFVKIKSQYQFIIILNWLIAKFI